MEDSQMQHLVDLQQILNESRTNCQAFGGPGLRMFYKYVCGILYIRFSIQGNTI